MDTLREDVALANRIAYREGLVTAFGHVSARVPDTDTFLIPPRAAPGLATPDSLLTMNFEGNVVDGQGHPNSEMWIHARIYAARVDVGAVAHVHSPACVVLSQLDRTVRPIHNSGALAGQVSVFRRPGLIRTRDLGDAVASELGSGTAMLLRGHGANTIGADVREAIVLACFLEESAELQLKALAATGGDDRNIGFYDEAEVARLQDDLSGAPMQRAWDYYVWRAGA